MARQSNYNTLSPASSPVSSIDLVLIGPLVRPHYPSLTASQSEFGSELEGDPASLPPPASF